LVGFFLLGFPAGWRYQIYAGQFRPPGIKALTAGSTTVFLSQPANIATREISFHEDGWNGMEQMFPRRKFGEHKVGEMISATMMLNFNAEPFLLFTKMFVQF